MKSVTNRLGTDEAVLEYVLTEHGEGYCLFMSALGDKIVRLGSAGKITTLAETFVADLKNNRPWKIDSRELYNAVLAPIPDIAKFSRLTIIPDGVLHILPFDALLTPPGPSWVLPRSRLTRHPPPVISY